MSLPPTARSASLACVLMAMHGTAAAEPSDQDTSTGAVVTQGAEPVAQARDLFVQASQSADAGDWRDALAKFEQAFALHPHATTLYNIGYCHAQLGELSLALQLTSAALDDAAMKPELRMAQVRRHTAEAQLRSLLVRTPRLTIQTAAPRLDVQINGRPPVPRQVGTRDAHVVDDDHDSGVGSLQDGDTVYLDPGTYDIVLAAQAGDGQLPATKQLSVTLSEGQTSTIAWSPAVAPTSRAPTVPSHSTPIATLPPEGVALPAAPAPPDPVADWRTGAFITGGAGMAIALTAGVIAWNADQRLSEVCSAGACPPEQQGLVERYQWSSRLTNVGLALGVAGFATGLTLYWTQRDDVPATLSVGPSQATVRVQF